MSEAQDLGREILSIMKRERAVAIVPLAERLGVSYEAVRQHLLAMLRDGLVARRVPRPQDGVAGRPAALYSLTRAGEHHFEKRYDRLAVALVGAITTALDVAAVDRVLGEITDRIVGHWAPRLRARMLERRVEVLRDFYVDGDEFMDIEIDGDRIALVERNCPYLDVALASPRLCSTTVTALSRLLGCQVVRTERFQSGDGRCRFEIALDAGVEEAERGFRAEPDVPARSTAGA
jgi:predicted ArsR family transcriptional regulator